MLVGANWTFITILLVKLKYFKVIKQGQKIADNTQKS